MIWSEQISTIVQSKIGGDDGVELYFIIIVTITYYYRLPLYLVFLFFWHEFTDRDTSVKSTERARTKLQRFRVILDTSSGKIGRATNIPTTSTDDRGDNRNREAPQNTKISVVKSRCDDWNLKTRFYNENGRVNIRFSMNRQFRYGH